LLALFCSLFFSIAARADWFDGHWQFRRSLDVNWDADHADGRELAVAEFYADGHITDGSEVRVTLANGHVIPSHVLGVGPGDLVRVVFALTGGQTSYDVYFGNPAPPPPPPGTEDVQYTCGLLMELRQWTGRRPNTPDDFVSVWDSSGPVIGQTIINQPFYGLDPFGEHSRCIAKLTGSMVVPIDAEYYFAGAANNRGAIFIDNKPALFLPGQAHDTRYNAKVPLTRGRHDFVAYYAWPGADGYISLAWRPVNVVAVPGPPKVEVIPRTMFGIFGHARAGPLEERDKSLTADFDIQYEGEYFVGTNYSHRYLLTAHAPASDAEVTYNWDLGDGLKATGPQVEHIFVTRGLYPITLTVQLAGNSATQTIHLFADRDWPNLDRPVEDPLLKTATILAGYDVRLVPEHWLTWMTQIAQQNQNQTAELAAAGRIADIPRHANADNCMTTLESVSDELLATRHAEQAAALWDRVPQQSDLQPMAATHEAGILLWWLADFPKALATMEKFSDSTDPPTRRAYAEALVLSGRAADGEKIFSDLQDNQEQLGIRTAAVSGAEARTIEYRIDQRDWQTGEQDWETWETRCPMVFTEGYSVLLRMKLMEEKGATAAAAKVAEAFASSVPDSPYAPQLLDRASKLLAKSDPAKSKALRDELKDRYPEDPLSQTASP
jgi:hypothetical protein